MAVSFNRYLILPEIEKSELEVDSRNKRAYTNRNLTTNWFGGPTTPVTSVTVPLCVLGEVQLRFLCPDDLEEVRALCQDWFPIGERNIISIYALIYVVEDNTVVLFLQIIQIHGTKR